MITTQTILNQLQGEELYNSLIHLITEEFEDFAAIRKDYEQAMDTLQSKLGEHSVTNAMDAIRQQTVSNLLFSGFLGLKANLDNFINPLARNFLGADFETYLREETAHRLPKYAQAQSVLDQFYTSLSADQKVLYGDVIAYICYLDTIAPKLAHYCGYLLGNELLPRIIPGYHTDAALTSRYHIMMGDYLGGKPIRFAVL